MELGNQIKKYRNQLNMSQDELAEKIYVTRQTISNWENEKNYPDVHSLLRLSSLFGVSVDELIKGDLEMMKETIKGQSYAEEDIKRFNRDGAIFTVLMIAMVILPVPLATFAGSPTQQVGISFLKSYTGVCLEGAIIILACIIFSLFASAPPSINKSVSVVTMVWSYIAELVFNMLVLVGLVKAADRIAKEMFGL